MSVEKQIALAVLQDVNAAYRRGDTRYDFEDIQSAKENAIDGMLEAGWTRFEVSALRDSIADD